MQSTDMKVDQLMVAFASIASSGLILSIGESALKFCGSVLVGMDAMTRLVVNLPDESPLSDEENELSMDLRVAVHRQCTEQFLKDISHHSFNLVIMCHGEISPPACDQLSQMVPAGGCVLVPKNEDVRPDDQVMFSSDFHQADAGDCVLFVKKPFAQEKTRRGGRRARLGQV